MFQNICFNETVVKLNIENRGDSYSLSYNVSSSDTNQSIEYLSQYLPFVSFKELKMSSKDGILLNWTKNILITLGYKENKENEFILKNTPKKVNISNAVIYVPSNFKSNGFKYLMYHEFGFKTGLWNNISNCLPLYLEKENKLFLEPKSTIKYNKIEVIEFFLAQLKPHIHSIDKQISFKTSIYTSTHFDAYYLTNLNSFELVDFNGTKMEQRINLYFSHRMDFVDFQYHHNVSSKFKKELYDSIKNYDELFFDDNFSDRVRISNNIDPYKLIKSIKKLGLKHNVLVTSTKIDYITFSLVEIK